MSAPSSIRSVSGFEVGSYERERESEIRGWTTN